MAIVVNKTIPEFEASATGGTKVSNTSHLGKTVILYFYPKDNTPGCTRQAQAFSESMGKLKKAGAQVVGVSKDSVKSHCGFRDKYSLKFPLLSDPNLLAHNAFGAYGEKTMYGKKVMGTIRSTFIIDPKGKIAKVFSRVKVDGHADAVLSALKLLQSG